MTLDEMKARAQEMVEANHPDGTDFDINKVYENVMDGTLVSVSFKEGTHNKDYNHIHFGSDGRTRTYVYYREVLTDVSNYKERIWFFRFLEFAGMGGLIAVILILVFSLLLVVLAFKSNSNPNIVEVVKLSFTTILGYFFGSQATSKGAR